MGKGSSSVWPEALAALLYQVHESARIGLLLVPNKAMSDHRLPWSDSEKALLVSLRHRLQIATVKQLTDIFNMSNHQERSTTAVRTKLRMLGLSRRPQSSVKIPTMPTTLRALGLPKRSKGPCNALCHQSQANHQSSQSQGVDEASETISPRPPARRIPFFSNRFQKLILP